jgi:Uma2 family endonuclease
VQHANRQPRPYTRERFLEWESAQAQRWEFVAGKIKMMAGGSVDHNVIAGNIFAAFHAALGDGPCQPFQQNQKLAPEAGEDVTYPDVVVTCRELAGHEQAISQATVLVEVVSPSSRAEDHADKWQLYQQIRDLRHYLIVEQDEASVAVYSRASESNEWRFRRVQGFDATIVLAALGMTLPLAQIYRRTSAARAE